MTGLHRQAMDNVTIVGNTTDNKELLTQPARTAKKMQPATLVWTLRGLADDRNICTICAYAGACDKVGCRVAGEAAELLDRLLDGERSDEEERRCD